MMFTRKFVSLAAVCIAVANGAADGAASAVSAKPGLVRQMHLIQNPVTKEYELKPFGDKSVHFEFKFGNRIQVVSPLKEKTLCIGTEAVINSTSLAREDPRTDKILFSKGTKVTIERLEGNTSVVAKADDGKRITVLKSDLLGLQYLCTSPKREYGLGPDSVLAVKVKGTWIKHARVELLSDHKLRHKTLERGTTLTVETVNRNHTVFVKGYGNSPIPKSKLRVKDVWKWIGDMDVNKLTAASVLAIEIVLKPWAVTIKDHWYEVGAGQNKRKIDLNGKTGIIEYYSRVKNQFRVKIHGKKLPLLLENRKYLQEKSLIRTAPSESIYFVPHEDDKDKTEFLKTIKRLRQMLPKHCIKSKRETYFDNGMHKIKTGALRAAASYSQTAGGLAENVGGWLKGKFGW